MREGRRKREGGEETVDTREREKGKERRRVVWTERGKEKAWKGK